MLQLAWHAVLRGADVYAFLIGIMALSEIARYCGVFDWLAQELVAASGNSRGRLFFFVYLLGTIVTTLLSNDTTAVVLTPAIAAAVARTSAPPLPYLYVCAFVANAASFVLPISNPANLVVFGGHLPALGPWLQAFLLPSVASVVLTYLTMLMMFRRDLRGELETEPLREDRHPARSLAATVVGAATAVLVVAAGLHQDIGVVALAGAAVALALVAVHARDTVAFVMRHIAWHIIGLVAVLFIVVSELDRFGALALLRSLFSHGAPLVVGVVVALLDNAINNLPVALAAGTALPAASPAVARAAVVAVDLGPNLAISGSLATLLWMHALRRDGIRVTFGQFLTVGCIVTAPALVAALLAVRLG
jgi:arsenical pump membrane protein